MTVKEKIAEMLEDVYQAENYAAEKLENVPEGSLRLKKVGENTYYYHRTESDKAGAYLARGSDRLVTALEEKAYCKELLRVTEQEKKGLTKIMDILSMLPDFRTVFLNIPQSRRHLIKPFEPTVRKVPDDAVREWLAVVEPRKYVDPKACYTTHNGEKVRSKSELIIADKLQEKDVPYHYEKPLILLDENLGGYFAWHPDFIALNRRTGRKYYWEHFGMLDNPDYCSECQFKIEEYGKNGLFPGKNLIITSESSGHNLNTEYIDRLIKEYLK